MSDKTKIEWTDATWTPLRARHRDTGKLGWHCQKVSAGCENCYAERFNRRLGTGGDYRVKDRDRLELFLDERMLTQPLRWKKPRQVFVCSTTDLFADFVPDEMIDQVFAVMSLASQHTYQVLTKRAERMQQYLSNPDLEDRLTELWQGDDPDKQTWNVMLPLKNCWLGVSVEDQKTADERIPWLLKTPAVVRWISYEPALGSVDLRRYLGPEYTSCQQPDFQTSHVIKAVRNSRTIYPQKRYLCVLAAASIEGSDWITDMLITILMILLAVLGIAAILESQRRFKALQKEEREKRERDSVIRKRYDGK
jgi:protein gp37